MKHLVSTSLLIGFLAFFGVSPVFGAGSVETKVSVSASTGSNSARGGTTETGTSEANVFVETTVNGEVVESIEEHVVSDDGQPIIIERELFYESGSVGEESLGTESELSETDEEVTEESEKIEESDKKSERSQSTILVWIKKLINYVISLFKS